MLANYVIGRRIRAAEGMTVDLAVTRLYESPIQTLAAQLIASSLLKDYEVAASYFHQLAPFYAKGNWSDLELRTLDLYAQCLHHGKRNADYVPIRLKTMAKSIQRQDAIRQQPQSELMRLASINQASGSASSLSSILKSSKLLKEQLSLPMDDYFDRVDLGMYVRHSTDDDGFQFPLVLRSLLPESFVAESVQVQILSIGEDQRSELWLHANGQNIRPGMSRIWLGSNVSPLRSTANAMVADGGYRRCFLPGTAWVRLPFFLETSSLSAVFLRHPVALSAQNLDTRHCLNSPINDAYSSGPTIEVLRFACVIQSTHISIKQNQLS